MLTFACSLCNAQINLVPNPSFEDTIACPHNANQLGNASGWYVSRESPNYFNECAFITDGSSVPYNMAGYQYAHSGTAYCGFAAYSRVGANYREYFTCQLIHPLITGTKYKVSYYLSLANSFVNLSCNKIGLLFSTINYNLSNPAPVGNYSQFCTDSIITDTLNWVHIESSFIADSDYVYITVGNFFDDTNTDTIYIPLSDGASTCHRQITKTYFRTCSSCRTRSQAILCLYTLRLISKQPEITFGHLRYDFGGDRPSQTTHLTLFPGRIDFQG